MADTHPNVEVVRRLYDAFAATDLETILTLVDPDIVITQTEELPWGGEYRGYDGLRDFFGAIRGNIASQVTHVAVFSAGDRVVQVGRTAGTVNATGAAFDIDEVHLLTLRDGRVTRFDAHIDTPAMLAVLNS
jgi:uncharacterized protein